MQFIKLFIVAFVCSLLLDIIWLGVIAKDLYAQYIGHLYRKSGDVLSPIWPSAFGVYLLIVLGIVLFVLPKANSSVLLGLLWGGVFGGILYGVYDLTNHAILATWPINMVVIDMIWGVVLCGLTAAVTVYVQNKIS